MSKASAMATAVQVDVAEDKAAVAVCEPTPVAMEAFGCVEDDATTEVVVVAIEVVIVDVVKDSFNIILYCCLRKTSTYSDCPGHGGCVLRPSRWFIDQTLRDTVAIESICS